MYLGSQRCQFAPCSEDTITILVHCVYRLGRAARSKVEFAAAQAVRTCVRDSLMLPDRAQNQSAQKFGSIANQQNQILSWLSQYLFFDLAEALLGIVAVVLQGALEEC